MSDPDQDSAFEDTSLELGSSSVTTSQEDLPKISLLIHTMSTSDPHCETSSTLSFETNGQGRSLMDPLSASQPECEITTSFLSFSMSSSSPASRETLQVPRPKTHLTASFLSISMADPSSESKDLFSAQRLAPHRSTCVSFPNQVQKRLQAFNLSQKQLVRIKDSMQEAMRKGLKSPVQGVGALPMLPTYVCALPDSTERGHFLGLELSSTHVDVALLHLSGEEKQKARLKTQSFPIPAEVFKNKLFEFLAQCLARFLDDLGTSEKYFPLGFSFPFHCDHTSLNKCKLVKWTKDFYHPGVMGEDLGQLLQTSLTEHCKNYCIEVLAVLNDTVGVMMSCACEQEPCEIGLIIGDGTNCCYMEQVENIAGMENKVGRMCINTEWGSYGQIGELDDVLTEYDQLADKESYNPGICRYEKLVGCLYLCETIRAILATLSEKGELFSGVLAPSLLTKGILKFQDILDIMDEKVGLAKTKNFLTRQGLVPSNQDCFFVQHICQIVFTRSANLCAAGLAAIITHIRTSKHKSTLNISVAVSGAMYRGQTQYREIVQQTLKTLIPECTVNFVAAEGGVTGVALVAAAALRLRSRQEQVAGILAPLRLSTGVLEKIQNQMRQEMEKGLSKETHNIACVRMLPTFVRHLPDGSERGDFLALDLGGTNFRVLMVQVKSPEEGGVRIINEIYTISSEVAQSTDVQLFDHIVRCIMEFQAKHGMQDRTLPLGFTFSFPCNQLSLDKGILLRWTKGFKALGCVGKDVVQLLREAVKRQEHFDLNVVAIVNDTVGTMMSCAHTDPKCEIGLIIGTGCNACYMEEMRNVGTLDGEEGRMCINMEWGAFGDDGCLEHIMTSYDKKIDATSINPGQQSGNQGLQELCAALEERGLTTSLEEAQLVKEVCHTVSIRGANVCAAGLAAVVDKIRENRQLEKLKVTVGVDGTVYKMHAHFARQLQQTVALLAPKCEVKFLLSEDGSGKGAALIAAVASLKEAQLPT
ncbi:hexokinase-3 isoform X2 [Paroedura picta]|uniref:hexokinase-3 isoform X2 n=1 Tax=Paroedura picta TaxID=143630 RepID=UPI0040578AD6